ncbi:hypothetical protein N657DRAFT_645234 [Parathielavia appendiculata]|uniref:Uncharacterized protein n=1 Tax=Parathielavia appendiculata TaxID=2587402 RepID=A0AAN6TZL9_9PEZI|nr:hypothetical protein N657DRAFT_645234 [Parathielavia appendiculata]
MSAPSHEENPQVTQPFILPTSTDGDDDDRAIRVLVQTKTHLVPGDKNTEYGERIDAMETLSTSAWWSRNR